MGNKSKMKRHNVQTKNPDGETVTAKGWPENREMLAARLPGAFKGSTWGGVVEKAIRPVVTLTDEKGGKKKDRLPFRVVYQSDVPFRRRSA